MRPGPHDNFTSSAADAGEPSPTANTGRATSSPSARARPEAGATRCASVATRAKWGSSSWPAWTLRTEGAGSGASRRMGMWSRSPDHEAQGQNPAR
eukprot:1747556-Alexandrium_andersonii.AAC.1